jgi:hypothetical protein
MPAFAAAGLAHRTRFVQHQMAAQPPQRRCCLDLPKHAQEELGAIAAVGDHHLGLRTVLIQRLHLLGSQSGSLFDRQMVPFSGSPALFVMRRLVNSGI